MTCYFLRSHGSRHVPPTDVTPRTSLLYIMGCGTSVATEPQGKRVEDAWAGTAVLSGRTHVFLPCQWEHLKCMCVALEKEVKIPTGITLEQTCWYIGPVGWPAEHAYYLWILIGVQAYQELSWGFWDEWWNSCVCVLTDFKWLLFLDFTNQMYGLHVI